MDDYVDIVFDGPPGAETGRFVEVENPMGHSISFGEWIERDDGYWVLRVDTTQQLAAMLAAQRDLQTGSYSSDPAELDGEERVEYIRWNILALLDEVHEVLGEIGWKTWSEKRYVNSEAAFKELIDAWHFMMNIVWAVAGKEVLGDANVLASAITDKYFEKREVNAQRQRDGY